MFHSKKVQFSLNKFFNIIHLKKQYFKKIRAKVHLLNKVKETNYKRVGLKSFNTSAKLQSFPFITYVLEISFSTKNTLFHIRDYSGNMKFFYSAGSVELTGKRKTARSVALRRFYRIISSKLKFIRNAPLAVHFKNVNFNLFWFVKRLKKKFLPTLVKYSKTYPYNGCRKKKIRRKKFKSRSFNLWRNAIKI